MKFVPVASLFDWDVPHLALLSTFQFDPDFFERRILRSRSLAGARRIVVFVDSREWQRLCREEPPARLVNRRYLVAPVRVERGVFHPKLTLLLSETGAQVLLGSNNLTRAGCSSNLELLNRVGWSSASSPTEEAIAIAQSAFAFFTHAVAHSEVGVSQIVAEWLQDARGFSPWLSIAQEPDRKHSVRFVHSYDGPLWAQLAERLAQDQPKQIFVISPYHDHDCGLLKRVAVACPGAAIELLVQQESTQLVPAALKGIKKLSLSSVASSKRRLHAKLIAWQGPKRSGCLIGSANFTSRALDGHNVEACLLLGDVQLHVANLFDGKFGKRPLALADFTPPERMQEFDESPTPDALEVLSAILDRRDQITVRFRVAKALQVAAVTLEVWAPGENRPRLAEVLAAHSNLATLAFPSEAFSDSRGSIVARLSAMTTAGQVRSAPAWIVQQERLTHEASGGSSNRQRTIEESGEGLLSFLLELGERDGVATVIDYLQSLRIQFNDGGDGGTIQGMGFRVKIRDPYTGDAAPGWLLHEKERFKELAEAVLDFVDRHIRGQLRRHSKRGNINGMPNFVDIFRTLAENLLYFHRQAVIKDSNVLGRLRTLVEVATVGRDAEDEAFEGYLETVRANLRGNLALVHSACRESQVGAHVRAALVVAQDLRFDPREPAADAERPPRPRDMLPTVAKGASRALAGCEPTSDEVRQILESMSIASDKVTRLLDELPHRLT